VGASSARESLLIQLRMKKMTDTLAYGIVDKCFDALARQQYLKIASVFKVKEDDVKKAVAGIRELSPYPGMNYSVNAAQSVVPDIIVTQDEEGFRIEMAGETPDVKQNTAMIKEFGKKEETKEYIKNYENRIKTLMAALNDRNKTIKTVVEKIIEVQGDYLKNEKGELKPLILKEIAEKVSLSESTISRIVSNKYIQMPYGVLPLKSFFSSKLSTAGGGVVSSNSVKDRIASIIENEDKSKPLTDTQITEILTRQNINISRRTVTKYREQLDILPVNVRKK
jgi:RNA polymerase sigma-54 factor